MRQLGTAVQTFQASKNRLPDYLSVVGQSPLYNPNSGSGTVFVAPYMYQLLPFIEKTQIKQAVETDMFGDTNFQASWFNDPSTLAGANVNPWIGDWFLKLAVCPSDPKLNGAAGPMSYAANGGLIDYLNDSSAQTSTPDLPANGAMGRSANGGGQAALVGTMDQISSRDGTSTTVLISENVKAGNWRPQAVGVSNGVLNAADMQLLEAASTVVWEIDGSGNALPTQFNFDLDTPGSGPQTPSSRHSGGFLMSFCDGHVTYIADSMDYSVYARLLTSNGRGAGNVIAAADSSDNTEETTRNWQKRPVSESDYEAL